MMSKICLRDQRREPERRLVEQQEPRPPHQGARDGEHLLLAARQRAAALAEPLGEAREQLEDAGEVAVPGAVAGRKRAHLQVLEHAHARKDAPALRGLGDVKPGDFVGRQLRNVAAGEFDAALAGARLAEDGHHQGRLAGAVGPDQGDDLALRDVEIDALERDDVAIIGLDPAQAEERGHRVPPLAHDLSLWPQSSQVAAAFASPACGERPALLCARRGGLSTRRAVELTLETRWTGPLTPTLPARAGRGSRVARETADHSPTSASTLPTSSSSTPR